MCRFIQHLCVVLQSSLGAHVCVEVPVDRASGSCLSSFSIEKQVGGDSSLVERTDFVRGVQSMLQKHCSQIQKSAKTILKTTVDKGVYFINRTKIQMIFGFSFFFFPLPILGSKE